MDSEGTHTKFKDENDELFYRLSIEDSDEIRDYIISELINNNSQLIWFMINKTFGRHVHTICKKQKILPDDFYSSGMMGLHEAIVTFDRSKGVKFSTYSARIIINHVIKMFRKSGKSEKDISLQKPAHPDKEGSDLTLGDLIPDRVEGIEQWVEDDYNSSFLNELDKELSDRDRELIYLRFYLELGQVEIAKKLGVSQVQVSRLLGRIALKGRQLQERLEGTG